MPAQSDSNTASGADGTVRRAVRDRYARAATGEAACCDPGCCSNTASDGARQISRTIGYTDAELEAVPADANLGLGCGNPTALAALRTGETVLDLGSGAGLDCFLAADRVGSEGKVIGVDMTPEMLERARANARSGGYDQVEFRLGEIEALPVADASVDVVISNCVLNLSTDRGRALAEARRVLRTGGRIAVSDMVSHTPVPESLKGNLDAVAGCLPTPRDAYLDEFRAAGFTDVRIVSETPYPAAYLLDDPGVKAWLASHPQHEPAIRDFATGIFGAHFEATATD